MGSNLYTKSMRDQLANAITNDGGNSGSGTIADIINGINNIKGKTASGSITCECTRLISTGSGEAGRGDTIYTNENNEEVNINIGFSPRTLMFEYYMPCSIYYSNGRGTSYYIKKCYYLQTLFPSGYPINGKSILLDDNMNDIVYGNEDTDYTHRNINLGFTSINSISTVFRPYNSKIGAITVNWFAIG